MRMEEAKYYHPAMESRIRAYCNADDWQGLSAYLDNLSHKDFRMAGGILGECLLPRVGEVVFWKAFRALLVAHSKAFLGTLLKAATLRKRLSGFTLHHAGFLPVAGFLNEHGTETDRIKFVRGMLEIFGEEIEELHHLFGCLHIDGDLRVELLLQGQGTACAYLLFQSMRQVEHNRGLLVRCCQQLMKKGDELSFNLACLAKVYFDLPQVKGTFSLKVSPYQLGRVEASYAEFRKMMTCM